MSSKEYGSTYISEITDEFTIKIVCPNQVLNSTPYPSWYRAITYDIPSRLPIEKTLPTVTLIPDDPCFTLSGFKVYDAATNQEITDFIAINFADNKFTIHTDDVNLVMAYTINLMALVPESVEEL